jgi:hypothetical protein
LPPPNKSESDAHLSTHLLTDKYHQQQLLERKIESVTADLKPAFIKILSNEMSHDNALTVCNYIMAMKTEINPSVQYRHVTIQALYYLARFHKHQIPYAKMTRDDVIMYLNSLHKPESVDSQHKFKGTYNFRRICFLRFFKWVHSPDVPPGTRPIPAGKTFHN